MPLLHWMTRDQDLIAADRVPYRLLDEVAELSVGGGENLLVQGDNLVALRALLPFYAGRVKCIYIDPPYNTGSAFDHYEDNLEHAKWLAMMVPRLQLLREFLSEDGSIWVSIDDREGHYLKVVMDEVFGRRNFVANVVWQKRYSRDGRGAIGDAHDHILVYCRDTETFKQKRNLVPVGEKQAKLYKNADSDPRGPWQSVSLTAQGYRPNQMYEIIAPNGTRHRPPKGSCWKVVESTLADLVADDRITFGKDGNGVPRRKYFLSEAEGMTPWTWWPHEDVGHNDEAKKETRLLFEDIDEFATPKPERLLQRILHIATNPGDLVLDSFLGSGTTAAVAHKLGRRWIGVEMGEHARTHCALRLKKVVEGEQGGISKDVAWVAGGGFRFCTLGETVFDGTGQINPAIRFPDLARHVWFSEFRVPLPAAGQGPFLGAQDGRGLALLYNGILKDRTAGGGNVLTHPVLKLVRDDARAAGFEGPITVYGAANRLSEETLLTAGVTFRQTPYDIKARA